MAPPQLGDEQIVGGPDWIDERDTAGRVRSIRTPGGEYPVAAVLAKLAPEQQPDVLVCLVDSSRRNLPRALGAFRGPKVLLVADTHHLQSPLTGMMRYASAERFDRIVFLYNRHHAPIFGAAGFKNLFWFPGLTFPHSDATVQTARAGAKAASRIAFVGQAGKHHPRRARMLAALLKSGLPVLQRQVAQTQALRCYAESSVGFNCSLNGDLNLRSFEILAGGGLLLTDRLGVGSGLDLLQEQGCEFATYGDEQEMIAVAREHLRSEAETRARAARGQEWFDREFNETRRRELFRALALDGVAPAVFPLPEEETHRITFSSQRDLLTQTLVYESLQEAHRSQETVAAVAEVSVPASFVALAATLPRVKIVDSAASEANLAIISSMEAASSPTIQVEQVWCCDADPEQCDSIAATLGSRGFVARAQGVPVYQFAREFDSRLQAAEVALRSGRITVAANLVQSVLHREPSHTAALLLTAQLALALEDGDLAREVMASLRKLKPAPKQLPEIERALVHLLPPPESAVVQAARVQLSRGHPGEAAMALHGYLKSHPDDVAARRFFSEILLQLGRLKEALGVQRETMAAVEITPQDWLLRARIYQRLGRAAEGLNDVLRAVRLLPESQAAWTLLAELALDAGLPSTAERSLTVLAQLQIDPKVVQPLRQKIAALCAAREGKSFDLFLVHNEVSRKHGTGVLLERYFGGGDSIVTLRGKNHYDGSCDLTATHLLLDPVGLSEADEAALFEELISNFPIRRILCVPYYDVDARRAVLAQRLTGAPLCSYVMDDQVIYAKGIREQSARTMFAASALRLVISPEMRAAYEERFGGRFEVMPPLLTSSEGRRVNIWKPKSSERLRAALVGNVWTSQQFEQLRAFVRATGLELDWFGNTNLVWLPKNPADYERDGIFARGFLPEEKLASTLVNYPFVVVPSGKLDGTETNEWLTRLSLPSRMVFILGQSLTPMLVIGHSSTAAAQFVSRFGLGAVVSYETHDLSEVIAKLTAQDSRAELLERLAAAADKFVLPKAGEWIWQSLEAGRALPAPFLEAYARDGEAGEHGSVRARAAGF